MIHGRPFRILASTLWCFIATLIAGCPQRPTDPKGARTIHIGAVLPLTGDAAKYGEAAKRAIDLAIQQTNAKGGVQDATIEVAYEDSQGTPKGAVSAFQKLISTDKVPAVIGDLLSSNTQAMAPIANRNKVVILSPTASAPELTKAGDYIFRNCASDTFEGAIMAEYAQTKLNLTRVAIIRINNAYGAGIRAVFKSVFTSKGGRIVADEAFSQGATDFRSQLSKVRATKPQAIYIVGYKELGPLLKQATELGIKTQFLSTVLFEDPEILKIARRAADGVIYSARGYDPDSQSPTTRNFVSAFQAEYNIKPDIFAGFSYDAANIMVQALKHGGTTSDAIKQALYGIKNYSGVTGQTSFDANGDVTQPATIKTVRGGKFVYVQ